MKTLDISTWLDFSSHSSVHAHSSLVESNAALNGKEVLMFEISTVSPPSQSSTLPALLIFEDGGSMLP